ncbi:MAG: lysylphosphatidylglycerol synthase transmembrane domain-containing protein [Methanomethylovorans sp.]|uniref:lysylphosphatidylglycerol synthase transmembrane domain-containing protein n=1 Tax=Methanomethylovorans sp. TaxID=2758717 RepID=UPI003C714074
MSSTKQYVKHIISFLFGLCILGTMIHYGNIDHFLLLISTMSKKIFALAIFIYSISWVLRVFRLQYVTAHFKANIKLKDLFLLHISSYALNVLLPAKIGDIANVLYLKLYGMKIEESLSSIVFTRILDLIAAGVFAMSFIFIGFKVPTINKYASMLIGGCLIFFMGLIFFKKISLFSRILNIIENSTTLKFTKSFIVIGKGMHVGLIDLFSSFLLLSKSVLLSLLIWFFEIFTLYFIALSMNISVPILFMIFGVALANIAKIVPATPGGIGLYEGIIVAVFSAADVGYNDALVIAVLDHLVKNLYIILIGVPATSMIGFDTVRFIKTDLNNL